MLNVQLDSLVRFMPSIPPIIPTTAPKPAPIPLKAELGDWIGCLWSAGSCWFMTGLFLMAWFWPLRLEHGAWVKLGVGVMVLEFISVHSGAFLNHFFTTRLNASRILTLLGFVGFYSLFGVAIALAFKSWWLLGSFALLMLGRIHSGITANDPMSKAINQRRTITSVVLYLLLTFATVFVPFPRGGITEEICREAWSGGGSGLWVDHPERALAMGAIYFLVLGWIEARPPKKFAPLNTRGVSTDV